MNAFERRAQLIDHMRMCKFDTVFNLATAFDASRSTILRDIQELTVNGYPIQADTGRGGGVRWIGSKKQFPFNERQKLALQNAIALVSEEDKFVLVDMLCEKTKPEVKFKNNDIFELLRDGKSQTELAAELGITGAYLSYLMSGQHKPSAKLAERISKLRMEVTE